VASTNRFSNEKKTRQQLAREQRTAEFVAANPGSLVVRANVSSIAASPVMQGVGLFFFKARTVHLIAGPTGIRAMQARNDAEWDKTWSEIVTIEATGNAPTTLRLDAVGWHAPKHYVICKPDGDPVAPGEVSGVVRQLREFAAMRHHATGPSQPE
jgi:hypothetical protein